MPFVHNMKKGRNTNHEMTGKTLTLIKLTKEIRNKIYTINYNPSRTVM